MPESCNIVPDTLDAVIVEDAHLPSAIKARATDLKRAARSAADEDGASHLYAALFDRPTRPRAKNAKPVAPPPAPTPSPPTLGPAAAS